MNEAQKDSMRVLNTELDKGYSLYVTEEEAASLYEYLLDEGYDLNDYRKGRYGRSKISIWKEGTPTVWSYW